MAERIIWKEKMQLVQPGPQIIDHCGPPPMSVSVSAISPLLASLPCWLFYI